MFVEYIETFSLYSTELFTYFENYWLSPFLLIFLDLSLLLGINKDWLNFAFGLIFTQLFSLIYSIFLLLDFLTSPSLRTHLSVLIEMIFDMKMGI